MCNFVMWMYKGCGHTVLRVRVPCDMHVPGSHFGCSRPGVWGWAEQAGLGVDWWEFTPKRCAGCAGLYQLAPGPANWPFLHEFLSARPAVQHVWMDREVRPYLVDWTEPFDVDSASFEDWLAIQDFLFRHEYPY